MLCIMYIFSHIRILFFLMQPALNSNYSKASCRILLRQLLEHTGQKDQKKMKDLSICLPKTMMIHPGLRGDSIANYHRRICSY